MLNHTRANLIHELRPLLFYAKATIISGAMLTLLARAYSRKFYVLLKQGAGPYMTEQELAWAHFYEASDPFIKPAIVTSWIVFVAGSFLHVLTQSVKYIDGIRKGLKGEGSRYQKRRQGAVRLGGIVTTIIIAFAIGYTQWGFFADLLAPVVMGSGAGAAVVGSLMGAVLAARIMLGLIKWGQRAKNKASNGKSLTELAAQTHEELDILAKTYGVENSAIHRYRLFKPIRTWHLHWVTGKTNVTLGAQNHLPQKDENNVAIDSPYLNVINNDYYFILLGVGLMVLLAAALLASPLTIPLTAPVIYFSAVMMGLSLGNFMGGMFTRYTGMPNANTSAWLILSVIVGISLTLSALSFGAPLIVVAVMAATFSVITLCLAAKVAYEEYRKKPKSELKEHVLQEEKIKQNAQVETLSARLLHQPDNTCVLIQNYFAAQHKLAHDHYQKNVAKLRRLSLLKEGTKEIWRGYKQSFIDTGEFLEKYEWWRKHSIIQTGVQMIAAILYGTVRLALSLTWMVLPFRRLYDYGKKALKDIHASSSTLEKVAKIMGYILGLVPVLLNPLYGSHYANKKEMYLHKKQQNKMLMRHAEEGYKLFEKNKDKVVGSIEDGKLTFVSHMQNETEVSEELGRLNDLVSEIKEITEEQKASYQEKYSDVARDIAQNDTGTENNKDEVLIDRKKATRVTTLFYLGVRSETVETYTQKLKHLNKKLVLKPC